MKREGFIVWGLFSAALGLVLVDEILTVIALALILAGYAGYLAGVSSGG